MKDTQTKHLELIFNSPLTQALDLFSTYYQTLTPPFTLPHVLPTHTLLATLLTLTEHVANRNYSSAIDILHEHRHLLYGTDRKFDFVYARMISFYYMLVKSDNTMSEYFCEIYRSNVEYGNVFCVGVLTNVVLDMLVVKGRFKECLVYFNENCAAFDENNNKNDLYQMELTKSIKNNCQLNKSRSLSDKEMSNYPASDRAIYYYYQGRVFLVMCNYTKARHCFKQASVMSTDKVFTKLVEKYKLSTFLLLSDLSSLKKYTWQRETSIFFELYESIKSGNVVLYDEVMHRNKKMYQKYGLYVILKRLFQNVINEGIRKVGMCYSRITIENISFLLNVGQEELEYLLKKSIAGGRLKGRIEQGVFLCDEVIDEKVCFDDRIKDVIESFSCMKKLMRYPKIKPLCYENIDKNSIAYDFTN
ncbi:26S proteasome non-ATPase regulatory subunit 3 [Conglomerata obtusa]